MQGQLNELFKRHPAPWSCTANFSDGARVVDANNVAICQSESVTALRLFAAMPRLMHILEHVTHIDNMRHSELTEIAKRARAWIDELNDKETT